MSNDNNPWAEPPQSHDSTSSTPAQPPADHAAYSGSQQPYQPPASAGFGGATAAAPQSSGAPEQTAFLPTQQFDSFGQPAPYPGPAAPVGQPGMPGAGFGPAAAPAVSEDGGIKALFDLSFRRYATPTLAKVIYILVLVTAGLWWLGLALIMLLGGTAASAYSNDSTGLIPGIMWLLFGWIPSLLMVCYARVLLELGIANIRTAQDADALRRKLGA